MTIPQNLPLPLVFAHVVTAGGACAKSPKPSVSTIGCDVKRRLAEAVEELKRTGAIRRLDVKLHKVWVSPLVWAIWKAEAKEGFAVSVAIYCAEHTASDLHYADVIDGQSGRMLAQSGPLGTEVF
jgi:hypothetical protein